MGEGHGWSDTHQPFHKGLSPNHRICKWEDGCLSFDIWMSARPDRIHYSQYAWQAYPDDNPNPGSWTLTKYRWQTNPGMVLKICRRISQKYYAERGALLWMKQHTSWWSCYLYFIICQDNINLMHFIKTFTFIISFSKQYCIVPVAQY